MEIILIIGILLTLAAFAIVFIKFKNVSKENLSLKNDFQKLEQSNDIHLQNQTVTEIRKKNEAENELSRTKTSFEKELSDLKISFEKQISEIKDLHRIEKENEYKRGYNYAIDSTTLKVQVFPHKEVLKQGTIFSKEEVVKVGFSYQLFANGIPCFSPHVHITETIAVKEVKEENIKMIIQKIDDILSKIPNPNLIISEGFSSFKQNLLNLRKN